MAGYEIGTAWVQVAISTKDVAKDVHSQLDKALGGNATDKLGTSVGQRLVRTIGNAIAKTPAVARALAASIKSGAETMRLIGMYAKDAAKVTLAQLGPVGTAISSLAKTVTGPLAKSWSTVSAGATKAWGSIRSGVTGVAKAVTSKVSGITTALGSSAVGKIVKAWQPVGQVIGAGFSKAVSGLGGVLASAGAGVASVASRVGSAVGNALSSAVSVGVKAAGVAVAALGATIATNLSRAVSRADTLSNFPRIMANIGYSADDARVQIDRIAKSLDGLPTATNAVALTVQGLAPLTGSLEKATDVSLALNDALLAGGGSATVVENAMEQYRQMLAVGTVDMAAWRSMQSAMPGQLDQMARALLGATANSSDLYDAMKEGTVSFEDFNAALVQLDSEGIDGLAPFHEQALTSTAGISTAFENARSRIAAAITKVINVFGVDSISAAINGFTANFSTWGDTVAEKAQIVKEWISDTVVPAFEGMKSILLDGEFTGPIFGQAEDSGLVTFLMSVREAVIAVKNGFEAAKPTLESIWAGVKGFVAEAGPKIGEVLTRVVQLVPSIIRGVSSVAQWLVRNKDYVASIAVAIGAAVVAYKTWTTALNVYKAAQNAAKVAQIAFNAAANANPIMLVVTAIAALVAGLWFFFTKTETGRKIMDKVWTGIKNVVGGVVSWFKDTALPLLQGAWDGIKNGVSTVGGAVSTVWDGIKTAVSTVVTWFSANVVPVFQTVFNVLKTVFSTFVTVVSTVWNGIMGAVRVVVDWFNTYVTPVITVFVGMVMAGFALLAVAVKAVWDGIQVAINVVATWFSTTLQPIIQEVVDRIKSGFDALMTAVSTAWDGIKTAINVVATWFSTTLQPIIQAVIGKIRAGFNTMKTAVSTAWNGVKTAINVVATWFSGTLWTSINNVISKIKTGFNTMKTAVSTAWNGVKTAINVVATWFSGTLWTSINNVISKIKTGFNTMKTAVGNAWNGIKSLAAKPVNFLIGTIYTDGIKKLVDKLTKAVGLNITLPAVAKIPGYASGGVLPGYTPGKDIYHFVSHDGGGALALSGGEAIMRPEWVRAVGGPAAVNAMNKAAVGGGRRGLSAIGDRGYQQFFLGGIWDKAKSTIGGGIKGVSDWLSNTVEAAAEIIADPIGAVTELVRKPVDALMANFPAAGMIGDAIKTIPGNTITSIGNWLKGKTETLGTGSAPVDFAKTLLGTPYVWGGSSIPPGLDCSGLVYYALNKTGHPAPRLTAAGYQAVATPVTTPVAGDVVFWGNPAYHTAWYAGNGQIVEEPGVGRYAIQRAVWGNPTYGRLKYDSGGLLQPGFTLVENATGKPEPVFTSGQWSELVNRPAFPETVVLSVGDKEFTAYVDERATDVAVKAINHAI
ncbi:tape measure protein [Actinomyces sp. MRS3W]|uniref:tape measure protein n=1 Tax=Actinomyces sp. MRS3W TaxID=2800796 RepID=UPI0028FDB1AE|nr:tape measure protein [Actinomyces sp. MRS3W]MDU0347493.1 tape measure protein [Actinomyces sp. MRS3W]